MFSVPPYTSLALINDSEMEGFFIDVTDLLSPSWRAALLLLQKPILLVPKFVTIIKSKRSNLSNISSLSEFFTFRLEIDR